MKLGTGKRMNKQISEISPKMTLPMFMIVNYFCRCCNKCNSRYIIGSKCRYRFLHWLTDYFGEPERKYGDGIWHNFMTFVLR